MFCNKVQGNNKLVNAEAAAEGEDEVEEERKENANFYNAN